MKDGSKEKMMPLFLLHWLHAPSMVSIGQSKHKLLSGNLSLTQFRIRPSAIHQSNNQDFRWKPGLKKTKNKLVKLPFVEACPRLVSYRGFAHCILCLCHTLIECLASYHPEGHLQSRTSTHAHRANIINQKCSTCISEKKILCHVSCVRFFLYFKTLFYARM